MFCNMLLILFHIYLPVDKPELMAVGQFHRWNFRYRPTQILSKVTNNHKKKAFGSEAKCFLFVVIYFADCPHREKASASLPLYIRHIQQSDDPCGDVTLYSSLKLSRRKFFNFKFSEL